MKNLTHKINIIVFTSILAAVGPILLFSSRPDFSEVERRELATFPQFTLERLLSGDFTRELNVFFSDTVPMRDDLAETSSLIKSKWGISVDGVTIHGSGLTIDEQSAVNEVTNTSGEDEITYIEETAPPTKTWDGIIDAPANPVEEDVVNLSNAGVLIYRNRALMIVGWISSAGERYANVLNEYARVLSQSKVYSIVAPTAMEFYCPQNYINHYGIDQRGSINNINYFLEGVTPVNAYSALSSRTDEDIFMRTDHHWSALGAYYAAEQFAIAADVPFAPLSEYQKVTIPDYVGTMYGFSGRNPDIKNNPEDFIYYKPANDYTVTYNIIYEGYNPQEDVIAPLFITQPLSEAYSTFLGGDMRIAHVSTDADNSRVLAIFKDSYGNALVPFLTSSFKEIYVIDIRYFPYNAIDYLTERGVTDVLFANNIAVANDGYFIGLIEDIMVN